jgi:hypothetical protein
MVQTCVFTPEKLKHFYQRLGVLDLEHVVRIDYAEDCIVLLVQNKGSNAFSHEVKIVDFVVDLVQSL